MTSPPRTVLGIHDGTHDAGAAVVRDGRIVAAANEERYTRVKGQGGWPSASIAACLRAASVSVRDLDAVAVAGLVNPNPGLRAARRLQEAWRLDEEWFYRPDPTLGSRLGDWLQFDSPFPRMRSTHPVVAAYTPLLARRLHRRLVDQLGSDGSGLPLALHDHHRCHAAGAYHSSGWRSSLVVVADGLGDGLATSVWRGEAGRLTLLDALPYPHSHGLLYATLTGFLGFRPFRHEGKLCGLAAHGDPHAVQVPFPFAGPPEARRLTQRFGPPMRAWLELLRPYRREDVCAWLQHHLEADLAGLVAAWARRTGLAQVSLAGGVFANVRLNQAVAALPEVEALWVHPHMGDGGLAAGAALEAWAGSRSGTWTPERMEHAFLGDAPGAAEVDAALRDSGLRVHRHQDAAGEAARILAEGGVVARYEGAMEYGPRALGHRSILAPADDAAITARLNQCLDRSDFMPFAPFLQAEDAEHWVEDLDPVRHSARFMTVAVQARPALARACPAAVHVDGSLRPQLVDPEHTPAMHGVLAEYRRRTGRPALLNTSFNMHEEPIVCSPADAVRTFRAARLDALWIGPHLATT